FDEHTHESDPEFFTIVLPTAALGPLGGLLNLNPAVQAAGDNIGLNSFAINTNYYGESKSFAAYGQSSYRPHFFDDKFEFTAGLRYSFDQKYIQIRDFPLGQPPGSPQFTGYANFENGAKNFHNLSWMLSASYQFTDDIMGYAKVSNAYKSGGFSPRS